MISAKHSNGPRWGRNKRRLRQLLIGYGKSAYTTRELLEHAYPRSRTWLRWQWQEIRRCAGRIGLVRTQRAMGVQRRHTVVAFRGRFVPWERSDFLGAVPGGRHSLVKAVSTRS
jgi:hypothetical protein